MPQLIDTLKSEDGINVLISAYLYLQLNQSEFNFLILKKVIDNDDKKNDIFTAFDEVELEEDEEEEEEEDDEEEIEEQDKEDANLYSTFDETNQRLIVENEYITEKLSALLCLQEIIKFQNPQFIDFYNECYEELKNLTYFLQPTIRKEAYLGLAALISYYHDFCVENSNKANDVEKQNMIKGKILN